MLYLVSTPIGNLRDITLRALDVLKECDVIACEDTRRTQKLLHHYDIKKSLMSYHEHNMHQAGQILLEKAKSDQKICLVTDAGMPGISDPGEELVRLFHQNHLPISILPGPTAGLSALSISGLPTNQFFFVGFLAHKGTIKKKELEKLTNQTTTMIFYESPHRLKETLHLMKEFFGDDRKACIVRELTKIYEEIIPGTLHELVMHYQQKEPKGEFVIIVEGGQEETKKTIPDDEGMIVLYETLIRQGLKPNDAIKQLAKEYGVNKRVLYQSIHKD